MDKILIKNGLIYDPLNHRKEIKDIAIDRGKIVESKAFFPDITIEADGCIVTPGLIDFHLHCYSIGSDGACDADTFCLPNGVTTCIDAGTSGSANFKGFYVSSISCSTTRVLALLHVAEEGLTTGHHPENQTPADWDISQIEYLCNRYPEIVGLKVRMGRNICAPYGLHEEPLREAIKLAEKLNKRVIVHVNDPNVSVEEIADLLRPGDVFCHMYAGKDENIIDAAGKVKNRIREARKRGVVFDASNGRGNFRFDVAEMALKDDFWPDIISSDNSPVGNYRHPLISLPRLLSKYMMYGMSIENVFDRAILTPAQWLGMNELASMDVGTEADVAIWKLKSKKILHKDYAGEERWGDQVLVPQLTIRGGKIVYAQADFL